MADYKLYGQELQDRTGRKLARIYNQEIQDHTGRKLATVTNDNIDIYGGKRVTVADARKAIDGASLLDRMFVAAFYVLFIKK
jgi:sporulation protein YlmC with PRC-barrel domain